MKTLYEIARRQAAHNIELLIDVVEQMRITQAQLDLVNTPPLPCITTDEPIAEAHAKTRTTDAEQRLDFAVRYLTNNPHATAPTILNLLKTGETPAPLSSAQRAEVLEGLLDMVGPEWPEFHGEPILPEDVGDIRRALEYKDAVGNHPLALAIAAAIPRFDGAPITPESIPQITAALNGASTGDHPLARAIAAKRAAAETTPAPAPAAPCAGDNCDQPAKPGRSYCGTGCASRANAKKATAARAAKRAQQVVSAGPCGDPSPARQAAPAEARRPPIHSPGNAPRPSRPAPSHAGPRLCACQCGGAPDVTRVSNRDGNGTRIRCTTPDCDRQVDAPTHDQAIQNWHNLNRQGKGPAQ